MMEKDKQFGHYRSYEVPPELAMASSSPPPPPPSQALSPRAHKILSIILISAAALLSLHIFVSISKGSGQTGSRMSRSKRLDMGTPGGFHDRIENLIDSTKCPHNFFLAWTTKAEQFTLRYRRTIESTLRFHPDSCVFVLSNTLPHDYFQNFWDLGYNIIVERPETEKLLKNTPAEAWLKNIDKWKDGPYFFSHITEILRLTTLWHYGGVYLDTDVIVMRRLKPDLQNCLGTELAGKFREAKVLNGAILVFEKGSRFIWEAMVEFNTTYRIDSWGWNGPELVTRVAHRFQSGGDDEPTLHYDPVTADMAERDLTVLPTDAFYPIHWARVKKYFTLNDLEGQVDVWNRIERNTYLFHYWNKITKDLVPEPGSLMYKVLNNYCLICNDTALDDGLSAPLSPSLSR